MLVAAWSKECTVYCFMAEGSGVRIPLQKRVYICLSVRLYCPGHKLIPLPDLQQYQYISPGLDWSVAQNKIFIAKLIVFQLIMKFLTLKKHKHIYYCVTSTH